MQRHIREAIKIGITFIFRFHRHPIQLVVFVPVGLLLFLRHLRQVMLGVEVSSVAQPGQLTIGVQISDWTPTVNYPGQAVEETATPNKTCQRCRKNDETLQKRTQLIEWDIGET